MVSIIEALYKAKDKINFGWNPESGAVSYNVYVGLAPTVLLQLTTGVPAALSKRSEDLKKVPLTVYITDVRAILGLPVTVDFSNEVFYFAITYVDSTMVESPLSSSTVVEVPPVGIVGRYMKDDPTQNRHPFLFSNEMQKWVKASGTALGATVVDTCDFFKSNITMEYTYDGSNVKTIKSYPSDATVAGYPAKLTTYTYTGGLVTKIQITDSTI